MFSRQRSVNGRDDVGLLGEAPQWNRSGASLDDTAAGSTAIDPDAVDEVEIAVVAEPVGADAFGRANETARGSKTPLVCVELGGVGGVAVDGVDAAVSGYAPGTACHDCLRERVAAGDPETDGGTCDASTARFAGALAGRELAALVAGRQSVVVGGVVELPHAQRRVLPVPYCGCGVAGTNELRRHDEGRPLEESIAMAEVAFDDRIGPISSVGEAESFPVRTTSRRWPTRRFPTPTRRSTPPGSGSTGTRRS